jgi:hypothetical protein
MRLSRPPYQRGVGGLFLVFSSPLLKGVGGCLKIGRGTNPLPIHVSFSRFPVFSFSIFFKITVER